MKNTTNGIYHTRKKILTISISFFLILTAIAPLASSENNSHEFLTPSTIGDDETELHLLRNEHYLYVNASDDVESFHIYFAYPPDYGYQVPIFLEIFNDTTEKLLHYQIEDDTNEPNKLINFTIDSLQQDESILLHFTCWVLIQNHDFSDLPDKVKFPRKWQLPSETKIWLNASKVVQKNSPLIRMKARMIRGIRSDIMEFTNDVARYIKWHRFGLFLLQLRLRIFFAQDAKTTLFINGENVGRSHLACAFLRSQNIPSRVILVHNDQGFWTQMHYMVEYYIPDYGWVLLDSTKGQTPYETKRQIINRICFPEDERDTKTDYIYPYMAGEERWLWIDTDDVFPYYVDCDTGSKSKMFSECETITDDFTADYTSLLTQMVFRQYQYYLGKNLSSENAVHFENAIHNQYQAIQKLIETHDPYDYIYYMDISLDEYQEIDE